MRRTHDWLRQAHKDLSLARIALGSEHFEWTCFAAHQAAEKSVKALLQSYGIDAWGHSVSHLLTHVAESLDIPAGVMNKARLLDRHCIPPRYPHSFPEGAPLDYYTEEDAMEAIEAAGEVLEFAQTNAESSNLK